MIRKLFRTLRRDNRGVTAVEFAVVSPVMLLMLMGLSEVAYQVWARAMLNGAVQQAGRNSALETGVNQQTAIDNAVKATVQDISPQATFTFQRRNYSDFASVNRPEDFTDSNGNGYYNSGECFSDVNGNRTWDADRGVSGQGGADDVTEYTVTATYPRLFPMAGLLGWSANQTITAKTVLKNQPYDDQSVRTPVVVCT